MCTFYNFTHPCGHTETTKKYCDRAQFKTVKVPKDPDQDRGRSKTQSRESRTSRSHSRRLHDSLGGGSSVPPSPNVLPSRPLPPSTPTTRTSISTTPALSPSGSDTSLDPSSPATPRPSRHGDRSLSLSESKPRRGNRDRSSLRPSRRLPPPPQPKPKPAPSQQFRKVCQYTPCANSHTRASSDPAVACCVPGCWYETLGRLWVCCRCERRGREVVGNRGRRCRGTRDGEREIRLMPPVPVFDKEIGGWA
ncbi:hypothetical protein B0T18DRAFT_425208 [Schizothecium vesticola]|uniref:Uncharacterized protein n=1 Tax=Schizothecium vesticola TaxID=314040 RepID=A0AA40KD74_9PEZI|nr:hypothetical protein B0T18DRAFT_425208 [Schizothecium vesticola]